MTGRKVILAAGGTGGHIFLLSRSATLWCAEASPSRSLQMTGGRFDGEIPISPSAAIRAASPSTGGVAGKVKRFLSLVSAHAVGATSKSLNATIAVGFEAIPRSRRCGPPPSWAFR